MKTTWDIAIVVCLLATVAIAMKDAIFLMRRKKMDQDIQKLVEVFGGPATMITLPNAEEKKAKARIFALGTLMIVLCCVWKSFC